MTDKLVSPRFLTYLCLTGNDARLTVLLTRQDNMLDLLILNTMVCMYYGFIPIFNSEGRLIGVSYLCSLFHLPLISAD
ncbi:hypothetical protein BDV36DRAFT_91438 [Aspergillus pseudocaelatus]|uniref:CBS domain-containing protein n=1 Tax=Aspergillus pseudocaelatus TaxID=1825620 RepID=A0ABQ6W267_9EURO|nr:hypothetical protein BDV36DRAFT_91438 [Aspergillus pseudocaelatus]